MRGIEVGIAFEIEKHGGISTLQQPIRIFSVFIVYAVYLVLLNEKQFLVGSLQCLLFGRQQVGYRSMTDAGNLAKLLFACFEDGLSRTEEVDEFARALLPHFTLLASFSTSLNTLLDKQKTY